jgi:hypothetical protein
MRHSRSSFSISFIIKTIYYVDCSAEDFIWEVEEDGSWLAYWSCSCFRFLIIDKT